MTFQDCGRPSINWYNGKIIDTRNPDANYFPTTPGQFNHMGQVYANNNVTIMNGVTAIVPAQNATQCNSHWSGFDTGGFYGSLSGYYWWNWFYLHLFIPAFNFATEYATGFARSGGSGGGRGGLCPQNLRLIRAQLQQQRSGEAPTVRKENHDAEVTSKEPSPHDISGENLESNVNNTIEKNEDICAMANWIRGGVLLPGLIAAMSV